MHRLNELAARLTPAELKEVEDFAVHLLENDRTSLQRESGPPNRIRLDELDGLLVRLTDEMPDEEISKRLLNEWADAAED